jgi:hypothetical protein
MGRVKTALCQDLNSDDIKKVFIPQLTPGYDSFSKVSSNDEPSVQEKWWKLDLDNEFSLLLYAMVRSDDALDRSVLDSITSGNGISIDDEGDIDFF